MRAFVIWHAGGRRGSRRRRDARTRSGRFERVDVGPQIVAGDASGRLDGGYRQGWLKKKSEIGAQFVSWNASGGFDHKDVFCRQRPIIAQPIMHRALVTSDQPAERDLRPDGTNRPSEWSG